MQRVIVITSGKGGVGKTTVTANLGLALGARGKSTVVVEGDIGLNNLDVVLGAENKIMYDAGEVALGKATVEQALVEINEKVSLFPATTGASNLITMEFFAGVTEELKTMYEYVLVDSPAGIEDNFYRAIAGANEALVVTTPHISSVRDGFKTVQTLLSCGIKDIGLIVNRVRGEYVYDKSMLSPEEISKVMNVPLTGILPEDDYVNLYGLTDLNSKKSGITYSYSLIAEYIDGVDKKLYDCVSTYGGLKRLRRWFHL